MFRAGGNMQQIQVGWDLISVYKQMAVGAKMFVFYLVIVLVFSVLRSLHLARQLWFFPWGKGISHHKAELGAADMLAARALANKLPYASSSTDAFPQSNHGNVEARLQVAEAASARFSYLWELTVAKVTAMKRLAVFTLIFSVLIESYVLIIVLSFLQVRNIPDCDCAGGGNVAARRRDAAACRRA